jgi:gamma-glutamyltranspeptidase/glutathione hydrolase/leukotriene-C4 hydrolase
MINDSSTVNDPHYYGSYFYNPKDDGTAHISIVAPNGDAVAVTSTINLSFGSEIMSPCTGIIYNDQMDDFSYPCIVNDFDLPPSPNNFPKAGKRPLSSMSPSILIDTSGDVKLVVGASGGTKITTATALTSILNLQMEWDIEKCVDAPRLHHQLSPMTVEYESSMKTEVVEGLIARGHIVEDVGGAGSVVGAIDRVQKMTLHAKADWRKSGGVDGF